MTTISGHTTRATGTILTASIYNADHTNHISNVNALNAGKVEAAAGPVGDGNIPVFDGTGGANIVDSGVAPVDPSDTPSSTDLASTSNGDGASLIGVEDAAGNFAGGDVEAVLAEIIADYAATTNGNGASKIGVEDSGGNFSSDNVEDVLVELAGVALPAATQADMETATSNAVSSTPGRQHFHPGHPKAWVNFNGTGTLAIGQDYGVSSVTDNGTGDYTVNFDIAFSAATYSPGGFVGQHSNLVIMHSQPGDTKSTSAFQLQTRLTNGANTDPGEVGFVFCGDQ